MKYNVRVDGRSYEVEIRDLNARPIIAVIEDEQFEIWPEEAGLGAVSPAPVSREEIQPAKARPELLESRPNGGAPKAPSQLRGNGVLKTVRAPIPGVVISLAVQPEVPVTVGQELCVLEAMKMKNSIRATRAGRIAAISVSPGQHVKHQEVLMEYAD